MNYSLTNNQRLQEKTQLNKSYGCKIPPILLFATFTDISFKLQAMRYNVDVNRFAMNSKIVEISIGIINDLQASRSVL